MKHDADTPLQPSDLQPALDKILALAKIAGATDADAVATHGRSLSIGVRSGEIEDVDSSEGRDLGLRVLVGDKQACVSTSDLSKESLSRLAERAVAMAKMAPSDPYCGLAPSARLETHTQEMELFDPAVQTAKDLETRALELETAALAVKGVAQADGASASATSSAIYFATSGGFSAGWRSSRHNISVLAIAHDTDGAMERDYDYHGARWLSDLKSTQTIGTTAGERAISRLGGEQLPSGKCHVMFDRRVASSLVGAFTSAISGPSISRGVSFLKDSLGETVFNTDVNIIDNPRLHRGHGSRPWDGEGLSVSERHIIESGKLTTWLLNCSSARQLGLESTGHAYRSIGAPPGVASTNMILQAGDKSREQILSDMGDGLIVTDMFGPSLNSNTGDYSVGVSGFKIENGLITTPVTEVTVAGNLIEIFKNIIPANDLIIEGATASPSLYLGELTIAGA